MISLEHNHEAWNVESTVGTKHFQCILLALFDTLHGINSHKIQPNFFITDRPLTVLLLLLLVHPLALVMVRYTFTFINLL